MQPAAVQNLQLLKVHSLSKITPTHEISLAARVDLGARLMFHKHIGLD